MPRSIECDDLLDQRFKQRRVDAGGRLVEQDQARLDHQHARKLEELLLAAGELSGDFADLVGKAAEAEHLESALARLAFLPSHCAGTHPVVPEAFARLIARRQHDVLQNRHLRKGARYLEGPGKAGAKDAVGAHRIDAGPGEGYRSRLRPPRPCDQIEKRATCRRRSVRSDR